MRLARKIGLTALALLSGGVGKSWADSPPLVLPGAAQPAQAESPFKDLTPPAWPEAAKTSSDPAPALVLPGAEKHESGFYGNAEALLWTPHRQGMDYGLLSPTNNGTPAGQAASVDYQSRAGLQTEVGYRLASGWDFGFGYTYFISSGSAETVAPAGGVVYTSFSRPAFVDQASVASSQAKLRYNVYDFVAGRTLMLEDDLHLRFFGGVRFANIAQNQSTFYNGLQADQANFSYTEGFSGAGPMVGLEMEGKVFRNWSLFGKFSAGMILGSNRTSLSGSNDAGLTPDSAFQDNYRQMVPMVNLGLGVGWEYRWLSIRVGYEVTNWFGINERPQYTGEISDGRYTTRNSDLSLDGVSLQLGIRF